MKNLIAVLFVVVISGFVSGVFAQETGLEECDTAIVEKNVVVVEKKRNDGLVGIAAYDVLDKLNVIAKNLGNYGVSVVEYEILQDGGVKVFFSLHPTKDVEK